MTPWKIVRLTPENADLLDRVADEVFDRPIRPQRVAVYVREPNHFMFVAVADGEVIGQCAAVLHRHPDKVTDLYIDEVGVTQAWQRKGVARAMLEAMFALGRSLGCGEAWVGTEIDNFSARRLYESFGAEGATFMMFEYEI